MNYFDSDKSLFLHKADILIRNLMLSCIVLQNTVFWYIDIETLLDLFHQNRNGWTHENQPV